MELSVYRYKNEHPIKFAFIKKWIQLGLPVLRSLKHNIANDIHTEMIIRLMAALDKNKSLTQKEALEIHYKLGEEIGGQLKELLSIDENNTASISKIMDFIHGAMNVKGKTALGSTKRIAISIWSNCPLQDKIKKNKYVNQYCNLQQEIYRGIIYAINPLAKAQQIISSENCGHCELKTWIE